jgi:serine/threonine protein kinase
MITTTTKMMTRDFGSGYDARDAWWNNNPEYCKDMGTRPSLAPEQVPGSGLQNRVSPATSVFQVGLLMYELMTLTRPIHQMTFQDQRHPFPLLDNQPNLRALVNLASECVSVAPAARPSPKDLYMRMRTMVTEAPSSLAIASHQRPWSKLSLDFDLWRDFQ